MSGNEKNDGWKPRHDAGREGVSGEEYKGKHVRRGKEPK